MIQVEIVYADAKQQLSIPLRIEESCTVAVAIKRSSILEQLPNITLATAVVGVYGKKVTLDATLRDGDRVEIYRPLNIDPKQARLLRAKKQSS